MKNRNFIIGVVTAVAVFLVWKNRKKCPSQKTEEKPASQSVAPVTNEVAQSFSGESSYVNQSSDVLSSAIVSKKGFK